MSANTNLHKAKDAKNDFYTQLTDVAKELMHYKAHFKDKIAFCNCEDPTLSLKELMSTLHHTFSFSKAEIFTHGMPHTAPSIFVRGGTV